MSVLDIVGVVLIVVLAVAWHLTYTAARLDRLHTRVEGTYAALDAQLVRRAEAALEVANSGCVDPAGALILAGAAAESLEAGELPQDEREAVESDLTRAIRLVVDVDPAEVEPSVARLASARERVVLARRFHNDAVIDVQRLRANVLVKLFHLAGHTDLPRTVEFDDQTGPG